MMSLVCEIISNDKASIDFLAHVYCRIEFVIGEIFHFMNQLFVERHPQHNYFFGIFILIILKSYPFILIVDHKRIFFVLHSDEALKIVYGTIAQVSQNFFFAPFIWTSLASSASCENCHILYGMRSTSFSRLAIVCWM